MNKKNNSVMKCNICENRNIGEFIVINNKKYHLCCIENLQQENTQLKQQLKDKDEKISKAIEYCNGSTFEVSTREWGMLNVINYEDILEILEILESNKED